MLTDAAYNVARCHTAVLENPADDTLRLILADAYDEEFGGLSPRGEFVRVQVEESTWHGCGCGGSIRPCRGCYLRARAAELEAAHRRAWLTVLCPDCYGNGTYQEDSPVHGDRCVRCRGTGDAGGLTWAMPLIDEYGAWRGDEQPRVEFRRGLPFRVTVPRLADCTRTKLDHDNPGSSILKPSRWLAAVVRHWPCEEVVCLDREPRHDFATGDWSWVRQQPDMADWDNATQLIPDPLWQLLDGELTGPDARVNARRYPSYGTAVAALARAVVAFARSSRP